MKTTWGMQSLFVLVGTVPIDPADFHFVVELLLLDAGLEFFPSH
jgi:hypothetical protein